MAVTLNEGDVATELSVSTETASRYFSVAREMIRRYVGASAVPDAIENEAVLRVVGYLNQSSHNPALVSQRVDDLSVRFTPRLTGILTRSGAEALLSSFVTRRAI